MAFLPRAHLLLLLAVVCIQLSGVLADGPDRCWCLNSLKKRVPREEIEEFSIFPRRSKCDNVEIILTLKPVNNSTEVVQRCLSPEQNKELTCRLAGTRRTPTTLPHLRYPTASKAINESAEEHRRTEGGIWKL